MGIISFLEENMLACRWKEQFGVDCTGCGMQRSIIHLLKGEFVEAFYFVSSYLHPYFNVRIPRFTFKI